MKKKIYISSVSALAVLALASCGSQVVKDGSYKKSSTESYDLVDYVSDLNYAELTDKDVDIYINYEGESGITFRGTSWFNTVDGKTYTQGSLLPTWSRIADLTKTNIHEACGYTATSTDNAYVSIATAGYKSEVDATRNIDLFYNSTDNLTKAGNSGTLVDLYDYIYPKKKQTTKETSLMPNLWQYLRDNPSIEEAITSGGHIYYTPYLDGLDEVQNTFIIDTEMVVKVLADGVGDTETINGGTNPSKNVLQTGAYTPFIKDDEQKFDITWGDWKREQSTVYVKTNIIDQQNELLQRPEGCTGKELADQLREYIKTKYKNLVEALEGGTPAYSSLADLYISEKAAYNTDELIALMRVIKANPGVITGDPNAEVEVFFPRGETSEAIESIYDLAQLWGVQGIDSKNGNYYFGADGTLNALETTYASYDALAYISALYAEGLILDNFYVSSATPTSTRYYDQYFKKTGVTKQYGFMMYDDPSIICAANDYESAGTKGIRSILPPRTYWSTEHYSNTAQQHLFDENGNVNTDGKTMKRYYESTRSIQTTSWAIPATSDNKDAALRIMDFMYSEHGRLIQNYGPENYWSGSTIENPKVTTGIIPLADKTKENDAVISDLTRLELSASRLDFWSFMRGYIGATHGIGYVRLSGLNQQVTNEYGRPGLNYIRNGVNATVVLTGNSTAKDFDTASYYTWNRSVPPKFSTTVTDTNAEYDGITGFWQTNKLNKREGWVSVVVADYNRDTMKTILEHNDKTLYIIKTSQTGSTITYADMFKEMDAMNKKCLWQYAKGISTDCVPDYIIG